MASTQAFRPNWASAPGDTIADLLRERGLAGIDFAKLIGLTQEAAADLLEGRTSITLEVARRLERAFGASVEFWMSRDFQYHQDTSRLQEEFIMELPIEEMVNFGWLQTPDDPSQQVATILRFFNVPSVGALRRAYAALEDMVAFRTSPAFDSRPAAVAAWLRQGEIEADAIACRPWDAQRFQESLSGIRGLTRQKNPKRFLPELERRCAENGVAVVVVRAPSGCRASGATRFLSRDKALLMLSFRYLTDDQFWFTFFHEAGHLLLHGKERFFLEGATRPSTKEEKEANEFAARTLVPSESLEALMALPLDGRQVIRFAVHLGVSPGIVVGQLQHLKKMTHRQLNNLKRRFTWGD
jgi:HTH-type transcriptional regulator/antitoxin HigA